MGRCREFINHCFGIVLNGCFAFAFYQVVFAKTVVECGSHGSILPAGEKNMPYH